MAKKVCKTRALTHFHIEYTGLSYRENSHSMWNIKINSAHNMSEAVKLTVSVHASKRLSKIFK